MSAIAGIIHLNNEPINTQQITDMMTAFQTFPADDIQMWKNDKVFLGCHGQWITPESIGEIMPFYDYDRKMTITADAIIDNRDELFEMLKVKNDKRKTIPDSQLILLAYDKWNTEAPNYLIGDYAFMIWDENLHQLFGARDFSGARTLYFYHDQGRFAFSTTIKTLLTLPYVERKLNEKWLAEFIAIPGMVEAVDIEATPYKEIAQLPPSHSILVNFDGIKLRRYSMINHDYKLKLKSNEEYKEAFYEVFNKATTSRIRTHGKVGSHLSGGLDSGTVVSFAARSLQKKNKQLNTFSYIPEDNFKDWTPKYYAADERPFIKETVNFVGNIDDHYYSFEGKDPYSDIDEFLSVMEMPYKFFENAFWLKGMFEKASELGHKILLTGARGNHSISWGSWQLSMEHYADLLKRLKWIKLYHELDLYCKNFKTGKSVILPIVAKKAFPSILRFSFGNLQSEYSFPSFIHPALAEKTDVFNTLQDYEINPTGVMGENLQVHRKNHYEKLFVWNKSGTATTKLSLRYSIWDRDPTNDIRVIRFCLALPEEQFAFDGMERSFIRRATEGILPNKVRFNHHIRGIQGADTIHRMKKIWLVFVEELHCLCKDPVCKEIFNIHVLENAITKIGIQPQPELIWSDEFKLLTRSLIVYRFIKTFL